MNGITILIWVAIIIIGAVAIVGVKRHFNGDQIESREKPKLSKDSDKSLFSFGRKNDSNTATLSQSKPEYTIQEPPAEVYPIAEEAETSSYQSVEYESQNQVLINYENEVKKFQEPMTQNQIDIMTSNNDQNEKHELKDLFTIDELIKESKRKDSEREKESQKIQTEAEDTTEIKESIRQKQEKDKSEEELIEEIMADEEIGELLNEQETKEETIQDIIDSTEAEEPKEETIQDIIDSTEAEEPKEETIQDIIDTVEAEEPKEETIQDIIDTVEAEKESVQDVLDVEEAPAEPEVPEPATQKDIAEAISTASQEIEEEKEEAIGFSESEGITDAVLGSEEEEIKQPTLKSPTKIDESSEETEAPIDDSNLYTSKEVDNDLDYRKDLAKITNTIKGSRLFQDVKEKIKQTREPEPEIDPIADLEESYIRTVNDYEEDEYAPIINETHDEFGEEFEPFYNEDAIREENTRRLMKTVQRAPEPEVAKPVIETIKPKPARENIKIKMGNADMVLKKGDEIIFKHDGETYSSQVYAINGDDISVRYRRKDIIIKPEDVKKIY